MKPRYLALGLLIIAAALAVIGWAAYQANAQPAQPSFAQLMPRGAVLFLEAKDFARLLREWSASPEKQAWWKSDNYQTFSNSRLFLRLGEVQSEFATAAGVPPDMSFLDQVAGDHTALAIYDIGKLELLYIAHLPSARAMQSALWQTRSQYEPRLAAGRPFFVRTEPQSGRVVAFAVVDDYLVLGTREDLVAAAVSLIAGQKLAALSDDAWYAQALKSGREPGDLRMVIHLAEVTRTPQFRTYWVQQNITHMRQYESALSDLYRSPAEYREERVLFPKTAPDKPEPADDANRVADLLRLVPPDIGVYRASAAPAVADTLALLEDKVLVPKIGPAPAQKWAPVVNVGDATVGSESNLEVRIDTPPVIASEGKPDEPLKTLLTNANVRAVLLLARSQAAGDGVFVRPGSTVVLSSVSDWNEPAARQAVQRLVAPALTTANLGAAWRSAGARAQSYAELDGLLPVAIAARGHYLIVSNDAETVSAVLARMREAVTAEPAVFAAGFNHARERENFYRLTALVDRPGAGSSREYGGLSTAEPEFFSQNLASLSRVFGGVKSQTVVIRRNGGVETQTVRYLWSR